MDKTTQVLSICGIVGPISYTIVVIVLGFLWPGYNHVTQAISELGGVGAPDAIIMNIAGFALTGTLIAAFALGLHRGISGGNGSKIGPSLLAIYGIGMFAVAFFPWDKTNLASLTSIMHSLFGWTHWIAVTLALLIIPNRLRNDSQWKSYRLYTLSTGLVTAILIVVYAFIGIEGYNGALQRVIVGAQLLWIEITAANLLRLSTLPNM